MNSAIYLMQHIKLENRGNTQEKTHCSTANINVQAALRMHPIRRKIKRSGGASAQVLHLGF